MSSSIATKKIKNKKDDSDLQVEYTMDALTNFLLPFAFAAAFISWVRNSDTNVVLRVIYAFFAYLFNIIYIVYVMWKWLSAKKE